MNERNETVYLDHAATSFPKAPGVTEAMVDFMTNIGANPGRSGHRLSTEAARTVYRARSAVARFFAAPSSERVVFTANITHAINTVLYGYLRPGDHVITTGAEHNALTRPLSLLASIRDITITRIPTAPDGQIDPADIGHALGPKTRLIALLHGSNVTGVVRDLPAIVAASAGIPILLDTAQTAGALPISLAETPIAFLCFTGHKSLLGPPGTGGVVVGPDIELEPVFCGGTGSNSEEELQPTFLPDSHESGTLNTVGLAGLEAAIDWLSTQGVDEIARRERLLSQTILDRLLPCEHIVMHGPRDAVSRLPTFSLSFAHCNASAAGLQLDREAGICARVGLHCSPSSHHCLGTWPDGTVRISAGPLLSTEQLDTALDEIITLATKLKGPS